VCGVVDLMVMSRHGCLGPSKWFIRGVARNVLQCSPVLVFLIPSLACGVAG